MEQVMGRTKSWSDVAEVLRSSKADAWQSMSKLEIDEMRFVAQKHWLNRLELLVAGAWTILFSIFGSLAVLRDGAVLPENPWLATTLVLMLALLMGALGLFMYAGFVRGPIARQFTGGLTPWEVVDLLEPIGETRTGCEQAAKLCMTPASDSYRRKVVAMGRVLLVKDVEVMKSLAEAVREIEAKAKRTELVRQLHTPDGPLTKAREKA